MALPAITAPNRTLRLLLAAVAFAAFFSLFATACGESRSQKEAGRYADSLCTDVSGWELKINGIVTSLDSGNPNSVAKAKLNRAAAGTVALVNQIHGLQVPDVDGAAEAKQNIDQFVADSNSAVDTVKAGVAQIDSYGTGAGNVATVALPIGLQLTHLATEGKTTVTSLEKIKGPFQHAVKNSDTCQALKQSQNENQT
jgi:hypothetical protein